MKEDKGIKMLKLISFDELKKNYCLRPVIVIGAGKRAVWLLNTYDLNYKYVVDSDEKKEGKVIEGEKVSLKIQGWEYLEEHYEKNDLIIVTPSYGYQELTDRIETILERPDVLVLAYSSALQWDIERIRQSRDPFEITKGKENKIPKTIHYFWFSGDPYPDKVKRCLDSWHKFCPDYEFKLWSLENYKTDNVFCNEALSKKVWAFASDFGRCDVLYRYGGIYMDLDVELIKPLDDLLYDDGFFCFESKEGVDPGSGMGCTKCNEVFEKICKKYENLHFINEDGTFNKVDILKQYTSVLEDYGLKKTGRYQLVNGIAVYPPLVFSPYSYQTGIDSRYGNTYGIHHWVSAWISEEQRMEMENRKRTLTTYIQQIGGLEKFI